MKVSVNWLKRYIEFDLPTDELAEIMTSIGLEVEGVEEIERIKGGLQGIVTGQVKECIRHPNADKLTLCKVDVGTEVLQIVCGAPNVAVGQKVLVALVGTTLYPIDGEPWRIKKGKIRGEESNGMICAEDELGLGDDHSGIMVLDEKTEVGLPASTLFDAGTDVVIDVGLTPNRSDATNHLGVARDIAAFLKVNRDWKGQVREPEVSNFKVDIKKNNFKVEVLNSEACPRYSGVVISGVKIGESPGWLKKLLREIDVRPISNIVDITNFILHEIGQPLHAFDAEKIAGEKIIVQTCPGGTPFISLDEQERQLSSTDLMICDGEGSPMCIGGVFGGIGSGVTDTTHTIFLEAAHFNSSWIRRSSTHHLLRTDAARIFEKGSDPNITVYALKRAALMIQELAGGQIVSDIIDIYPEPIEPVNVFLHYQQLQDLTGIEIEREKVHDILRAMEMELKPVDEKSILVRVPTNKADVTREVDVIEEILRIYGFNNVPLPDQVRTSLSYYPFPSKQYVIDTVSDFLSANGFNEMMGLSLIESKAYKNMDFIDPDGFVYINNTSNIHLDIMRPEPMLSGLLSVLNNLNHYQRNFGLYEIGRTYRTEDHFVEKEFLSLFMTGARFSESWVTPYKEAIDFYDIKKWVSRITDKLGILSFQVKDAEDRRLSYGLTLSRGDQDIVTLGEIDSSILHLSGIGQKVFYAEFDIRHTLFAISKKSSEVEPLNKYPSTRRDLALVIDEGVKFEEIRKIALKAGKSYLREIGLFDIYKNKSQLGEDKKSYAVKFIFEDSEKTLKDKEVDKIMQKMIAVFEQKLGARIRR